MIEILELTDLYEQVDDGGFGRFGWFGSPRARAKRTDRTREDKPENLLEPGPLLVAEVLVPGQQQLPVRPKPGRGRCRAGRAAPSLPAA
jgi:hypothetical protein